MTEREFSVCRWYDRLCLTSNEIFLPLYFARTRWLVMGGGAGSGKSRFAARKLIERCMSEAGHRMLVCRKVYATLRESCWALLKAEIESYYPDCGAEATVSPMQITFPNGSEILFAGLDDVEKLKSIHRITSVWVEEASECDERDIDQLNIRLRDPSPWYKQIILTFNPVSALHWIKRRFFDAPAADVTLSRSTYRDNRFLPPEYGEELEKYRDIDPYYYSVYALGEWGVLGLTVFPAAEVTDRLGEVSKSSPKAGLFAFSGADPSGKPKGAEFSVCGDGPVKIFREAEADRVYVIGADTAGDGSDAFAAHVIDCESGEQCAVIHMRNGEDAFLEQLWALGMMYNGALIACEVNFSTYIINMLAKWRYPRQYVREAEDTYTGRHRKAYGFRTTAQNRNRIIAELVSALRGNMALIHDVKTLEEMLTFVRNEDFRPEAQEGAHDDLIMALAIAYHARCQAPAPARSSSAKKAEWTADMWEDWRRASAEDKEYLISVWGDPGTGR